MKRIYQFISCSILFVLLHSNVWADLVFSAPPRGTEEAERATYEPLAEAMSKVLGIKVVYEHPRNFITYSVDMQNGRYDIVFDGPHFAQWRVTNLNHTILVNLPENLQFLVITKSDQTRINSLRELVYEKICAQLTPQLGTLMLLKNFAGGASEPRLVLVQGEDKVFKEFTAGKCTAAILRDKTFNKLPATDRASYKVVYQTAMAPNDALTVNNKITPAQRKSLIALLTNPNEMKVAHRVFERFSGSAVAFNEASPSQFSGLDQLLELAFGWQTDKKPLRGYADTVPANKSTTKKASVSHKDRISARE